MTRRLLLVMAGALVAGSLAVLLAGPALAGGFCHGGGMTDGSGTQVTMRNFCFSPTILRVKPGQMVTFVNLDGVEHPVVGSNGGWGLDSGQRQAIRFDKAGLYPYFCHVHLGMIGVIVVGDGNASGQARPYLVPDGPAIAEARASQQAATQAPASATARASNWASGPAMAVAVSVGAVGALAGSSILRRRRSQRP
jgi:plastocyanin